MKAELSTFLKKINAYASDEVSEKIPTGFPQLDKIVCEGFPMGRSVEIFGDESGGKSSLALALCGEFIRQGKRCLWVDIEDSYEASYAEKLGVDTKKLHVMKGLDTGEKTFGALEEICKNDLADVIVVDSMSEAVPRVWIENDLEILPIGRRAALHARFLVHTRQSRINNNIMLVMLNQTREDINNTMMFKTRKSTAGTQVLHEVKTRIRMSRLHQIKRGEDIIGYQYKAEVVKNKVGPVKGTCIFHYMLATGFDKTWDLLDWAIAKGVITEEKSSYFFNGEKFAYGEPRALDALKEDTDFLAKIKEALK